MRLNPVTYLFFVILLGFSSACSPSDTPVIPVDPLHTPIPVHPQTPAGTQIPTVSGGPTITPSELLPTTNSPAEILPETLKIVYLKDRNIWLWTPTGRLQLTSTGDVYDLRLSPDGELVVFTRRVDGFHAELWLLSTSGGEARRLVGVEAFDAMAEGVRDPNTVAVNPYQFEWVPGTHHVAFNGIQIFDGPGFSLLDDLQIANADNFERWTLLAPGSGGEFTYAPDGNQVAIVTPTEINLMDANAGNWRLALPYEQVITYSEYRYHAQPVWSPDGSFLRVALPPTDPLDKSLATELWYLPADGSAAYMEGELWPIPFFDTPVAYAPDLNQLIYLAESGAPTENRRELRITLAGGGGEQVYYDEALLRTLGWGLDATHFAFLGGEDGLSQMGSLNGPPSPLPGDPSGGFAVHWIDERLYVFIREGGDGFELHLSSLDGATLPLDTVTGPPPKLDSFLE